MRTLFTILLILFMTGCSKPKVKEPSVEKSNQSSSTNGKKEPSCTFSCSLEKYSLQLFGDQSPTYFTVSKDGGAAKTYNLDVNWNNDSRIELKKLADTEDVFAIVHINPEENHYI